VKWGQSPLSRVTIARGLSTPLAWKILDSLTFNDSTRSEIGESLGVKTSVMGPRLAGLLKAGLIVARKEKLKSGKEVVRYSISKTQKSVGFPARKYFELSASLIDGIRRSVGEDGARMILRDIGLRIGEDIVQAMTSRFDVIRWDPKSYSDCFIGTILEEMETHPRVLALGKDRVLYEQLNCPFQELASSNPVLVCDVLDEAVHQGVASKLGASTVRLKCRGHGDLACRYLVQWSKGQRITKSFNRSKSNRKT